MSHSNTRRSEKRDGLTGKRKSKEIFRCKEGPLVGSFPSVDLTGVDNSTVSISGNCYK